MGSFEHYEHSAFIKCGEILENPESVELWLVAGHESVPV